MDRETYPEQGRRLTPEERAIRVKKLKKKRRIRLAIVVAAFAVLLALIISPIVLFAAFRVKTFVVEGTSPYSKEQIIEASGIGQGKSLIFANLAEATAAVEKNLPYTDDVVITKKLPSSIVIRYGETTKAFAIQLMGGTYALTNSELKVLELASDVPEGITLISGATPVKAETGSIVSFVSEGEDSEEETGDKTLSLILEITGAVAENQMENINLIDVSSRADIYLIYEGRMVLRLGDSSDLASKLSLGQRVIVDENKIDPTQYCTVNLTVAKKAYVNPSDPEDIKEIVLYNGGEWEEEAEEPTEDTTAESADYEEE